MAYTGTGRPRGRPAKPTEVHRALGNPSRLSLPDAPGPGDGLPGVDGVPELPVLGERGSELWVELWTAGESWLSPTVDRPLIEMLCQAVDEAEELRVKLTTGEVDRFYVVANGQQVTHPYVNQLKDLRVQITAWLAALGFSPTDRARLGVGEVRRKDILDELAERRAEREKGTG
jgi:P27 family predicted phage terminase small subunit